MKKKRKLHPKSSIVAINFESFSKNFEEAESYQRYEEAESYSAVLQRLVSYESVD